MAKGDQTFKVAKISKEDNAQVFMGLYSVMNEKNQVIGFWLMTTKSLYEISAPMKKVPLSLVIISNAIVERTVGPFKCCTCCFLY